MANMTRKVASELPLKHKNSAEMPGDIGMRDTRPVTGFYSFVTIAGLQGCSGFSVQDRMVVAISCTAVPKDVWSEYGRSSTDDLGSITNSVVDPIEHRIDRGVLRSRTEGTAFWFRRSTGAVHHPGTSACDFNIAEVQPPLLTAAASLNLD
jgi:hypothetical protein